MADSREGYLAGASETFLEAWQGVAAQVRSAFPGAQDAFDWDLPGWVVPLPEHLVFEQVGTFPVDRLGIYMADRKAGVTMHFWNPASYTFLDEQAAWLKEAGFKPMKGCLQFNRKKPYPVAAVGKLFEAARATWE